MKLIIHFFILTAAAVFLCLPLSSQTYHVSPDGDDSHPGNLSQPFKTVGKAATVVAPGSICYIHEGIYRETVHLTQSGTDDNPITFKAYDNEKVVIDGRDLLQGLSWQQMEDGSWAAAISDPGLQQALSGNECILFSNDYPFVEARWPNMKFHENWIEDKKWAMLSKSSIYKTAISQQVASLGFSVAGGALHLKYVENFIGSCEISAHAAGSPDMHYESNAGWGDWTDSGFAIGKGSWDYRFYITGVLDLLDAEDEWFYDTGMNTLYVKTPGDVDPDSLNLSVKARDYGIYSESADNIVLEYLQLFGTSIKMGILKEKHCRNLLIRNCKILYPNENRSVRVDPENERQRIYHHSESHPFIDAESALIENCEIGWAANEGIHISGRNNIVRNCVIHNTSLDGRMNKSGIYLGYGFGQVYNSDSANTLEHSTVYNAGGVGLYHHGPGPAKIQYNHFFNASFYSGDISCTYLPYGAKAGGTELSYNWIHGVPNGKGMRCDTKGNYITVHHNLVWDSEQGCKWKGDGPFFLYNNTYFADHNLNPFKLTGESFGYQETMDSYDVMNNISFRLYFNKPSPAYDFQYHENDHFTANYKLVDPVSEFVSSQLESIDLRPAAGSPFIDAGAAVSGITDNAIGDPDIGAYEYGGDYWYPGADWLNDNIPVPVTMAAATKLSNSVRISPLYPQEYINSLLRKATNIAPYQGSVGVSTESQLFFNHGYEATSAHVYFGTDSVGVANATNASTEFLVNISYPEHEVDLNDFDKGLQAEAIYYWRVDAIDEYGVLTKGDLWYFTCGKQMYLVEFRIHEKIKDTVLSGQDVMISLKGIQYETDSKGISRVIVPSGENIYTLHKRGFEKVSGSINVVSDTAVYDTIQSITCYGSIHIKDEDTGVLIPNSRLKINGGEWINLTEGIYEFENDGLSFYNFGLEADSYIASKFNDVEIYSDTLLVLSMTKNYINARITVRDRSSGNPVYRVQVNSNSQLYMTNSSGVATLEKLIPGITRFTLVHDDYFLFIDSLKITMDTSFTKEIDRRLASATFTVSDGHSPISGALIEIENIQFLTGIDGRFFFLNDRPELLIRTG